MRFHKAHYDFLKKRTAELPAEIEQLKSQIKTLNKNQAAKLQKKLKQKTEQLEKYKEEIIAWSPENFEKLSDFEKAIHQKAFTTNVNDPDYHKTALFSYEEDGVKREIEMPKGDILHQFRQDVNNGKLPTVSWLVAPQYFSDHPSAPWFGAWYVSEVMDILTKNPEVWKKTIFILNYDENDGYFDHVPPFVAPKPNDPGSGKVSKEIDTSEEYVTMQEELTRKDLNKKDARESPVGLGYRVPMVIASPWSRGGWVNSEVFNITSTLQFLETFLSKKTGKEIKETNISDWRRMITGDLTSVFRPYNGEKIKLPWFVKKDPFIEKINNAKYKKLPSGYKTLTDSEIEQVRANPLQSSLLPKQETGIRDSCALPYQLSVDGKLSADKKTFEISFAAGNDIFGQQSAGAPFSIYAAGKYAVKKEINGNPVFENVKVWNYAVKAGDELKGEWSLDHFENNLYHLRVYGPNGFFREFKGSKNDPEIEIKLDYERRNSKVLSGNVILNLKNLSDKKQTAEIADTTYKRGTRRIELENGAEVNAKFDLSGSYNWYDLIVKITGFDLFEKRYAGRVETGAHSKSDPAMGSMV